MRYDDDQAWKALCALLGDEAAEHFTPSGAQLYLNNIKKGSRTRWYEYALVFLVVVVPVTVVGNAAMQFKGAAIVGCTVFSCLCLTLIRAVMWQRGAADGTVATINMARDIFQGLNDIGKALNVRAAEVNEQMRRPAE